MTLPGRGAEAGEAWTEASSCDVCEEVGLTEPSVHLGPPAALLRGREQGADPPGDLGAAWCHRSGRIHPGLSEKFTR